MEDYEDLAFAPQEENTYIRLSLTKHEEDAAVKIEISATPVELVMFMSALYKDYPEYYKLAMDEELQKFVNEIQEVLK